MWDTDIKISDEDLFPIRDFIGSQVGIYFEEKKFYFLEKRVQRRMQATNTKTAKEYFRLLTLSDNKNEMSEFINVLTTNETYFYRNIPQLESFAEEILPLVVEEKEKKGDYSLRIWSAACSSGDEPYTISILLQEYLKNYAKWDIQIVATDIDTEILEKAELGVYDARGVKDVPPAVLKKYFHPVADRYQVVADVKKLVSFIGNYLITK